ncbi:HoxN/HupN/NixA family nickel/cobalt transporter [Planosporangium mesophilum]|uniref:Nickel/cobalt efflux system n=1 Tax=Planosporangium mesophilum TaxID=689768 RepID=A0A8J3T6M7_9ACTN|nr:HoxN/HupN/NixA family nickel/cobalt transporter [Planosporangium mesophilum]NJC86075.1 HoxN/HupN/NixA family nickel/cobalt transporter [Planosporangium mesophilum]GII21505.1 nickel/cobalt efflux system [Planosporangium mesophilum]
MTVREAAAPVGAWTRAERARLSGIVATVVLLNVAGWSLYLYYSTSLAAASAFAGAGTLAYVLGIRHAFDADHIAAIDDTTRLMLLRGRRPVGVGFFFAMGHSAVVVVLALIVAFAARSLNVEPFQHAGALLATVVAVVFLLVVGVLNATVLASMVKLWRGLSRGEVDQAAIDRELVNRGLMNRMLGGRIRGLIRSSWHMFPVGLLFGLGLETASEVTLLSLQAATASQGAVPALAVLTLPLLFAAGMSAMDTADSLLMTRAYSWAYRHPARRLYYNLATTGMTVVVALFVASVYLAGLITEVTPVTGPLASYAAIADHFELLGYVIVGAFVLAWGGAVAAWKLGRFDQRYTS